uniref:Uncharacterized protein n=1 Tax=Oryza punctata TaxID=4537 RepID=A0A0E0M1A4_ORYPU
MDQALASNYSGGSPPTARRLLAFADVWATPSLTTGPHLSLSQYRYSAIPPTRHQPTASRAPHARTHEICTIRLQIDGWMRLPDPLTVAIIPRVTASSPSTLVRMCDSELQKRLFLRVPGAAAARRSRSPGCSSA